MIDFLRNYWRSIVDSKGQTSIDGKIHTIYGVPIYRNGQIDGAAIYAARLAWKKRT